MIEVITAAHGHYYQQSAQRLSDSLSNTVSVCTSTDVGVEHECPRITGLLTKIRSLAQCTGEMLFIDSDMEATNKDVLAQLPNYTTELALCEYPFHSLHTPDKRVNDALRSGIAVLNTGFILIKEASIAKELSQAWESAYRSLLDRRYTKNNWVNDEHAFYIALQELGLSYTILDRRWNDFMHDAQSPFFEHHTSDGRIRP